MPKRWRAKTSLLAARELPPRTRTMIGGGVAEVGVFPLLLLFIRVRKICWFYQFKEVASQTDRVVSLRGDSLMVAVAVPVIKRTTVGFC